MFVLYMSTRSFQQQSIRPILINISQYFEIDFTFPNINIHYAHKIYSLQNNPYGFIEFIFRKCAHVFVYSILTILGHLLFFIYWKRNINSYIFPLGLIFVIACIDETMQKYSLNRSSSPYDVLLDFSAGCLSLLLVIYMRWLLNKQGSKKSSSHIP